MLHLGKLPLAILAIVITTSLCACASNTRKTQLERVAKDWSLTIRASQVIPIYPLREDLAPGDLFLVSEPLQAQHKAYIKRGFLALPQELGRLKNLKYSAHYGNAYGIDDHANTPHHWQFPPSGQADEGNSPQPVKNEDTSYTTAWNKAPRAAFPNYTFEVDMRKGLGAAVPIQGVPVAMSLMQTDRAFGSVTLSKAYTYGLPLGELDQGVRKWAAIPANRAMLDAQRYAVKRGAGWGMFFDDVKRKLTPNLKKRTIYVRVIARVYLISEIHVVLQSASKGSGTVDAGVPKALTLPEPSLPAPGRTTLTPAEAKAESSKLSIYQEMLKDISANIGGSAKLEWASNRSVSMKQNFDRPLVIGYISFDYPVLDGGVLDYPVATLNQLESGSVNKAKQTLPDKNKSGRNSKWIHSTSQSSDPREITPVNGSPSQSSDPREITPVK